MTDRINYMNQKVLSQKVKLYKVKMELSSDLFNWLVKSNILFPSATQPLDPSTVQQFINGFFFAKIIRHISSHKFPNAKPLSSVQNLSAMQDSDTQLSKAHNWRLIEKALASFGIPLTPTQRAAIIAGDPSSILSLLSTVYTFDVYGHQFPLSRSRRSTKKPTVVETVDASKQVLETSTCLEMLLVTFSKYFSLTTKQAAGLLTQNGKYLSFIVTKGLKGQHTPVVKWYRAMLDNAKHLMSLIKLEEQMGSVKLVLSTCKPGFSSPHIETVVACAAFYDALAAEFIDKQTRNSAWEWLISEGLYSIVLAARLAETKQVIVSLLLRFGKGHLMDLFTFQIKKLLPEAVQYCGTMNEFLPFLLNKQELMVGGLFEQWIDMAINETDRKNTPEGKIAALQFVCDIWVYSPSLITEEIGNSIVNMLRKLTRDPQWMVRLVCHSKMFQMLDYAPIFYKIFTFSLIENYEDLHTRELILSNMSIQISKDHTFNIGVLVDPFIKHLQLVAKSSINLIEFEFLSVVAKHPLLTLKSALNILEFLFKVYSSNYKITRAAASPMIILSKRFIEDQSVQDVLIHNAKSALKIAYTFSIRKKNDPGNMKEIMLNLVHFLLTVNNSYLHQEIAVAVSQTYNFMQKAKGDTSAIQKLLEICGQSQKNPTKNMMSPKKSIRKHMRTSSMDTQPLIRHFSEAEREETEKMLKRYSTLFKHLFKKYASSGYKYSTAERDFDKIKSNKSHLTPGEYYKLLKEQGVTSSMFSSEELNSFLLAYANRYSISKNSISFSDFLDTIPHIACFTFSRGTKDFSSYKPVVSLKALIGHFRNFTASKGLSTHMYDQPDIGIGDREVIKTLNSKLASNPKLQIPDGYKKMSTQDIKIEYKVPDILKIKESKKVCIDVLDLILFKTFGFHILEPQVIETTKVYVKGVKNSSLDLHFNTPTVKYEAAKLRPKYKDEILIASGSLLEDLLYSVEVKSSVLLNKDHRNKVQNKITLQKETQKMISEKKALMREDKRRERRLELEEILKKQYHERSIAEEKEEARWNVIQNRRAELRRQKEIQEEASRQKIKEMIQKHKAEKEASRVVYEPFVDKARIDEFLRKEQDKIDLLLHQQTEKRRQKSIEEEEKMLRTERIKQKTWDVTKKLLDEGKMKQDEERNINSELNKLLEDNGVKALLAEFKDSLRTIFNHYKNMINARDQKVGVSFLNFYAFNKFTSQFNIWPGLLRAEDINFIFKLLIKHKPPSQSYIVYKEFIKALLRIAMLSQHYLEDTSKTRKRLPHNGLSSLLQWMHVTPDKLSTMELLRNIHSTEPSVDINQKRLMGNDVNRLLYM